MTLVSWSGPISRGPRTSPRRGCSEKHRTWVDSPVPRGSQLTRSNRPPPTASRSDLRRPSPSQHPVCQGRQSQGTATRSAAPDRSRDDESPPTRSCARRGEPNPAEPAPAHTASRFPHPFQAIPAPAVRGDAAAGRATDAAAFAPTASTTHPPPTSNTRAPIKTQRRIGRSSRSSWLGEEVVSQHGASWLASGLSARVLRQRCKRFARVAQPEVATALAR